MPVGRHMASGTCITVPVSSSVRNKGGTGVREVRSTCISSKFRIFSVRGRFLCLVCLLLAIPLVVSCHQLAHPLSAVVCSVPILLAVSASSLLLVLLPRRRFGANATLFGRCSLHSSLL